MQSGDAQRVDDEQLRALQAAADRSGLSERVELGLTRMGRAVAATDPASPFRVLHLTGLPLAVYRRRCELAGSVTGLQEAETLAEEARDAAGGPDHPM